MTSAGSRLTSASPAEATATSTDTTETRTRSTTTRPTSPSSAAAATWPSIGGLKPYYQDDLVVILHGDCRELLPSIEADVIVTDPPYGINWSRSENVGTARGSKAQPGIIGDEDTGIRDWALANSSAPAAVFGSLYAPFPVGVRQILIWQKPADAGVYGAMLGFRRDVEAIFLVGDWPRRVPQWSSVVRSQMRSSGNPSSPAGRTGHPHAKPVDLLIFLLDVAPPGTVLDPFMGSGTTLVAAKSLNRHAIGIEIEEKYCAIAAQRCSQGVLGLGGAMSE
jgi:site-specific DNA-methyltransferase (adenine-specific)